MWIVLGRSGGVKINGRNADDETGTMLMKGSCSLLHITMVPPKHLVHFRGKSGSYKEFNEE